MLSQDGLRISGERTAASILTAFMSGPSMQDENIYIAKHEEDIEKLKLEIDQKDEEITDLRKSVQELQEQNKNLDINLQTRNYEVKKLRERIKMLEVEKKGLQEELAAVNYKLHSLEKDVKSLVVAKDAQEEENQKLEEDLLKVNSKLDTVKSDLDKTKGDNEKLKKEVKDIKESTLQYRRDRIASVQPTAHLGRAVPSIQLPIGQINALVCLGQLCQDLQCMMYKAVLPEHFTPIRSYKVKAIVKDIRKLPKTSEDKEAAVQRWEELKCKLNWKEDYEEALKSLQDSRNQEAHPKLNDQLLRYCAEEMEKKGILKGWLSLQCIYELIQMWKQLECSQL